MAAGLRLLAANSGAVPERPMTRQLYLKWISGSHAPTQVLLFSHEYPTMNLKMTWPTPTHLDVAYGPSENPGDHVSLDFQVVKISGINISVHDITGEKSK
jgi:hypothetical protein